MEALQCPWNAPAAADVAFDIQRRYPEELAGHIWRLLSLSEWACAVPLRPWVRLVKFPQAKTSPPFEFTMKGRPLQEDAQLFTFGFAPGSNRSRSPQRQRNS